MEVLNKEAIVSSLSPILKIYIQCNEDHDFPSDKAWEVLSNIEKREIWESVNSILYNDLNTLISYYKSFILPTSDSIEYRETQIVNRKDTLHTIHMIKKYPSISKPNTSFYMITVPRKDSIMKKYETVMETDVDKIINSQMRSTNYKIIGINDKNQLVYHESYSSMQFGNMESLVHTIIELIQ